MLNVGAVLANLNLAPRAEAWPKAKAVGGRHAGGRHEAGPAAGLRALTSLLDSPLAARKRAGGDAWGGEDGGSAGGAVKLRA